MQEVEERAPKKANKQELEYNHALFALLRAKRKELADAAGVPPYVIFADRTLVEMAAYAPQSPERLLDISGVGQVKARQYGQAFLEVLQDYCRKHNLPEKTKAETRRTKDDSGRRYVMVAEAFNAGESLTDLMERYHVTTGYDPGAPDPLRSPPGTPSAALRNCWRSHPPLPTSRPPLLPPLPNWAPTCSSRSSTGSTAP